MVSLRCRGCFTDGTGHLTVICYMDFEQSWVTIIISVYYKKESDMIDILQLYFSVITRISIKNVVLDHTGLG